MGVATIREQDIAPYRRAVEQSRTRLAVWNPVDPDDLARSLVLQSHGGDPERWCLQHPRHNDELFDQ